MGENFAFDCSYKKSDLMGIYMLNWNLGIPQGKWNYYIKIH